MPVRSHDALLLVLRYTVRVKRDTASSSSAVIWAQVESGVQRFYVACGSESFRAAAFQSPIPDSRFRFMYAWLGLFVLCIDFVVAACMEPNRSFVARTADLLRTFGHVPRVYVYCMCEQHVDCTNRLENSGRESRAFLHHLVAVLFGVASVL
jgi:hypothetical protein